MKEERKWNHNVGSFLYCIIKRKKYIVNEEGQEYPAFKCMDV
ncbi:hypothetical protein QSI_2578 [Clostridioides difficile P28]|nr:hypothetical protein QSI_2578 [Clostridioides difficile P28]